LAAYADVEIKKRILLCAYEDADRILKKPSVSKPTGKNETRLRTVREILALQRDNPGKPRMELALLQAQTESRAMVRFCTRRKCRILRDEVAWVKRRTLPYRAAEE
jgi:hypothetical protein